MRKLRKFFRSMFSEWGSGLSGPSSIPFAVLALFASGSLQKACYASLAGILCFFSAYRIWDKEYERAETEKEKNQFPVIEGSILATFHGTYTNPYTLQPVLRDSRYYVHVRLVNVKDVPCTINRYRLIFYLGAQEVVSGDGEKVSGIIEHDSSFRDANTEQSIASLATTRIYALPIHAANPLRRGCAQDGWIQFHVKDFTPPFFSDLGVWEDIYTLVATDSFGKDHFINAPALTVIAGELTQ